MTIPAEGLQQAVRICLEVLCAVQSLNVETSYLNIIVNSNDLERLESNTSLEFRHVARVDKDTSQLTIELEHRSVPETIAELVSQGVRIYGANQVTADLESSFFTALDGNGGNQRMSGYKDPVH